jgi:unsaturated rhamnogalacturonyl hydrolase
MRQVRLWVAVIICGLGFAMTPMAKAADAPATQPVDDAGKGKVVGLDYYFNHQLLKGQQYHYIWEDTALSGYSKLGDVFKSHGATLASLPKAPTADDLKKFSIYIIVNSNNVTKPGTNWNYLSPADGDVIANWVHDGGVLALFANDVNNSDMAHLNTLSERFGITFNSDLRNQVPNSNDRRPGSFTVFPDHPIFNGVSGIYMKEICTFTLKAPAEPILTAPKEKGAPGTDIIMAVSHYGKGMVFAVGDPWEYNEYIDVTTPTVKLDNRKAAVNLTGWLLQNANPPMTP